VHERCGLCTRGVAWVREVWSGHETSLVLERLWPGNWAAIQQSVRYVGKERTEVGVVYDEAQTCPITDFWKEGRRG